MNTGGSHSQRNLLLDILTYLNNIISLLPLFHDHGVIFVKIIMMEKLIKYFKLLEN